MNRWILPIWWSCIGKDLCLRPVQPACFIYQYKGNFRANLEIFSLVLAAGLRCVGYKLCQGKKSKRKLWLSRSCSEAGGEIGKKYVSGEYTHYMLQKNINHCQLPTNGIWRKKTSLVVWPSRQSLFPIELSVLPCQSPLLGNTGKYTPSRASPILTFLVLGQLNQAYISQNWVSLTENIFSIITQLRTLTWQLQNQVGNKFGLSAE